jgi:xanthine dehydrogenase molybdopterin-binding subunit B
MNWGYVRRLRSNRPVNHCAIVAVSWLAVQQTLELEPSLTHRFTLGPQQATGEAVYLNDYPSRHDELHAALVGSSKAHAKLVSVDATAALGEGRAGQLTSITASVA